MRVFLKRGGTLFCTLRRTKHLLLAGVRFIAYSGLECLVWLASRRRTLWGPLVSEPKTILVLRTSSIGDLLITSPLFDAVHRLYPTAHLVAAIGPWNKEILANNPNVSEILVLNTPWFNNVVKPRYPWSGLAYILFSKEVRDLSKRQFDIGIDALGHPYAALILLRARVPFRMGVKGFAGGHTAMQKCVPYCATEQVGVNGLRFAQLLGLTSMPVARPQIFLTDVENDTARRMWRDNDGVGETHGFRVVIGPGAGEPGKCWPIEYYVQLIQHLLQIKNIQIAVVGGKDDVLRGKILADVSPHIRNYAGRFSLRDTFALTSLADLVIANGSSLLHIAAAFEKQTIVLLTDGFESARQHDQQWGYPGTCYSLGKEPGIRAEIYRPEEVMLLVEEILRKKAL